MIAQLTRSERQFAILISLAVAILGLLLGLAGRDDPIGLHGLLIVLVALLTIVLIGRDYEPSAHLRAVSYLTRASWGQPSAATAARSLASSRLLGNPIQPPLDLPAQ